MESVMPHEKALYRELLGSLMYVAVGSRPEISYPVSALSQFVEEPRSTHLKAGFRVLRYLKGTRDQWLVIGGPDISPKGYHDAAYANQPGRKSMSDSCYSWVKAPSCGHQEAANRSHLHWRIGIHCANTSIKDMIWLHKLLSELSIFITNPSIYPTNPTVLYSDSQNALSIAKDSVFHERTKHIGVCYHFHPADHRAKPYQVAVLPN